MGAGDGTQGDGCHIRLVLRALPRAAPVDIRLRRLLKAALRSFGFRAVRVLDVDGADVPIPGPTRTADGPAAAT